VAALDRKGARWNGKEEVLCGGRRSAAVNWKSEEGIELACGSSSARHPPGRIPPA